MFQSIHRNDPDPKLLAYQYLQTLPQIASGPGNTMWMIPSEVTSALKALSSAFDSSRAGTQAAGSPPAGEARPATDPGPALTAGGADGTADAALAAVVRNEAALAGGGPPEPSQAALAAAIAAIPEPPPPPEVALPAALDTDAGANGSASTA